MTNSNTYRYCAWSVWHNSRMKDSLREALLAARSLAGETGANAHVTVYSAGERDANGNFRNTIPDYEAWADALSPDCMPRRQPERATSAPYTDAFAMPPIRSV